MKQADFSKILIKYLISIFNLYSCILKKDIGSNNLRSALANQGLIVWHNNRG